MDYPIKHGLDFDTHRDNRRFYLSPADPILNTKFVVFKTDSLFFYAYDSYAGKSYMTKTFTGLYSKISIHDDTELKIYKKDFTDRFLRINKRKTGFKHIDDYLTITSKTKKVSFSLSKRSVTLFLEMEKFFNPFYLVLQTDYLLNINELKGEKVIGLETQQWLYKEDDIDLFLRLGGELIENVIKSSR